MGITEKLNLALNSKNAIKSTLVDRAQEISDVTPFSNYAGIIENMSEVLPDIASWVEIELPMTFGSPKKYTYDAEHIFIIDSHSVNKGIWCFNSNTQELNKIGGTTHNYNNIISNNNKILFYKDRDIADMLLYDCDTNECTTIIDSIYINKTYKVQNYLVFVPYNNVNKIYILDTNSFELKELESPISSRYYANVLGDRYVLFYDNSNQPYVLDINTFTIVQIENFPISSSYVYTEIDDEVVLVSTTSTSSTIPESQAGLWKWNKVTNEVKKIFDSGSDYNISVIMNNKIILRSDMRYVNIIIYDKNTDETKILIENSNYSRGNNDICRIPEGALITYANGGNIYVYNEENDELTQLNYSFKYSFDCYPCEHYAFLGTGHTATGYVYNYDTRTITTSMYFGSAFNVLETSFGQIVYNCQNGICINTYRDGARVSKVLGGTRAGQARYVSYFKTNNNYYFVGGSSNYTYVVRQSMTDYDDSEVLFSKFDYSNYIGLVSVDSDVYIYGTKLYKYNEETKETINYAANDFFDSSVKISSSYDRTPRNYLRFTDGRGIFDPLTNTVSTIPYRKYIWKNYTFDNFGVTNINNGQQYQFKYPYANSAWIDLNYQPSSLATTFNSTNILTAIGTKSIMVCNKE